MQFDRSAWTLITTSFLAVAIGLLHPHATDTTGVPYEKFMAQKTIQHANFDMVVGGDSRTLQGISPGALAEIFPDCRIFNFGFGGNSVSVDYVHWLANRLGKKSSKKTIILGVTPSSLTPHANAGNEFLSYIRLNPADLYIDFYLGDVIHFFRAFSLNSITKYFIPTYRNPHELAIVANQHLFPNGWSRLTIVHQDLDASTTTYIETFQNNPVSEKLIGDLIESVHQLTQQGIRMIGVRPPTTIALKNLENQLSGFNELEFSKRFESAGGWWFSFPFETYQTSDGSHLEGESAERFSRDLAKAIAQRISEQNDKI